MDLESIHVLVNRIYRHLGGRLPLNWSAGLYRRCSKLDVKSDMHDPVDKPGVCICCDLYEDRTGRLQAARRLVSPFVKPHSVLYE
jgi:hypothetical protein